MWWVRFSGQVQGSEEGRGHHKELGQYYGGGDQHTNKVCAHTCAYRNHTTSH